MKKIKRIIQFSENMQGWRLEKRLKEKGYKKVADAYWTLIFENGNKTIVLDRMV